MTKFSEAVQTKTSGCAKCFSMIYTLPCILDKEVAKFLTSFGSPKYPLATVKLIRIDAADGFHIEGRIGTKTIKFVMPKKYEKVPIKTIEEKNRFEQCLANWMTQKLNITIDIE